MKWRELIAVGDAFLDHRVVIDVGGGYLAEARLAEFTKVQPAMEDEWDGALIEDEIQGRESKGERVIILRLT